MWKEQLKLIKELKHSFGEELNTGASPDFAEAFISKIETQYKITIPSAYIETATDIDLLSEQYLFLRFENTQKPISIQATSYEELKEKGVLKYDNSILISSFDKTMAETNFNKAIRNIVIFYYNGSHYIYDCDTNTVTHSSREASISILAERLLAKGAKIK